MASGISTNYNPHGVSDPLSNLGFPSYLNSNGFMGVPAMFIDMFAPSGFANIGSDPFGNMLLGQQTGQLSASVNKVHNQHEIKFGFDGRIHQMNYIQTNAPNGFFNLLPMVPMRCPGGIEACGGDPMASFLMGQLTQAPATTIGLETMKSSPGRRPRITSMASSCRTTGKPPTN